MKELLANGLPVAPACVCDADLIRLQLRRILESPAFHGSKRCQAFLEYVVEKTLRGESDGLKERTIAVDIFDRGLDSDLANDTIVRVGAREVRRRLTEYYSTPDAASVSIRVELATRGYVPHFSRCVPESGGAVALAETNPSALDKFWQPILSAGDIILLVTGSALVYLPSHRACERSYRLSGAHPLPVPASLDEPSADFGASDLVAAPNQFVGFGDLVAASLLSLIFGRKKKTTHIRMANKIEFAALKDAPAVLIGSWTNRWAMELSRDLRFQFGWTEDYKPRFEEKNGTRRWTPPAVFEDETVVDDYILVSRILHATTGKPCVMLAGLKQTGTEAAGQLLSNLSEIGLVMEQLPAGWENESLQLVLHARVIDGTPTEAELVAHHQW